jgi:hypothetical protein
MSTRFLASTTHVIADKITSADKFVNLAACSASYICLPSWTAALIDTLSQNKPRALLPGMDMPDEMKHIPEVVKDEFPSTDPRSKTEWWIPVEARKRIWLGKTVLILRGKNVRLGPYQLDARS